MSASPDLRHSYTEAASPHQMYLDCRAATANLSRNDLDSALRRPARSIRFEDHPAESAQKAINVDEATARLAAALHLHLD